MEEFMILERIRLFKWNVAASHGLHAFQNQVLFLIKHRLFSTPETSNAGYSYPISHCFPFNPQCLSSTNNVEELGYEAVLSTQQFLEDRNIDALAIGISRHLVNNYSFGLETFSNPNAPKVLIVVEVKKTWVFKGFQYYGSGEIGRDRFNGGADIANEENILLRLSYLLGVPVLTALEPSDASEPLGLTQVPALHLFDLCDGGAFPADATCAICLEGLSMGSCRKMPCSHVFHGGCIAHWLWKKRSRPMCRSQLA
ncbi:hypothetical protein DITRI_Ditri10aG0165300 [Diplodiscus trichospermus]